MDQQWDAAGKCMHTFCVDFSLFAPSTFAEHHCGDTATWHGHQTAHAGTRNDYLLVALSLRNRWGHTWPDRFIDAGHARLDHAALVGSFWLPEGTSSRKPKHPTFDRQKIMDADDNTWNAFFADWPEIPWSMDVDNHAHQIEQHLVQRLVEFFPMEAKRKRCSIFSDHTWEIYSTRVRLRKMLADCGRLHHLWTLHLGLCVLKGFEAQSTYVKLLCLCMRTCGRHKHLQNLNKQLRKQVAHDKAAKADELLLPLQQAQGKQAIRLLKPLRLGKRHRDIGKKTLPMVKLQSGEMASTPDEALHRWRDHFGKIEGGMTTNPDELWKFMCDARSSRPQATPTLSDIPTLMELECQLRKTKPGKAMGPDMVPGEVLKAASPWLAKCIWPLLLKVTCHVQEPLIYKGGRLSTLFKHKGSPSEASNHRAILISSTIGKTLHNVFRERTMPFVRSGASELQYSAHPGSLVSLAAHTVRLHQNWAKRGKLSDYTIFIDIASAYYSLLRQLSMDLDDSDLGIITLLSRLGFSECSIDVIAARLQQPSALEEAQAPPHLRSILSEFHQGTWFRLSGDVPLVHTTRGTRPGDGLADALWALSFGQFLQTIEKRLSSLETSCAPSWNQEIGLLAAPGQHRVSNSCVAWADDLACIGTSRDPISLIPKIQVVTETIFSELLAMGLSPNLNPGKTEVVLSIRGSRKVAVQQLLHGPHASTITLADLPDHLRCLRVVPHYTHLGGMISHCGKLRGELRRRIGIARQSFADLSPKVFSNPHVKLSTRIAIFRSTVWLSLLYNAGTWPTLTSSEESIWYNGVLRLYRALLRRLYPAKTILHFTADQVLALVGLPHPLHAIRVCRLRHFGQVLHRANPFFWALVAEEQSWLQAVIGDFEWLYSNIRGLTSLPPPEEQPIEWHQMILQQPTRWKGLLKRVETHATLRTQLYAAVNTFHRQLLEDAFSHGLRHHQRELPSRTDTTESHVCWICRKAFVTFKAWGSHSFKAHGRTNACRHFQDGSTCIACGKAYPSNERLVRHFRTNPKCRDTAATLRQPVDAQPYYGSTFVRQRTPTDSMKTWLPSDTPTLRPGTGWPLTTPMRTCLNLLSRVDWTDVDFNRYDDLLDQLRLQPVHLTEILHLLDATEAFYSTQDVALQQLQHLRGIVVAAYTLPDGQSSTPMVLPPKPPLDWMEDVGGLYFAAGHPIPRVPTRMLYVVHLFSGTKRFGDLHSQIAQQPAPDGGVLCPISVDVVLDEERCDLLSLKQQRFWLRKAREGALYMIVAGPPCETWSVARMRYIETSTGPRPLRDASNDHTLWCLPTLRLKELRQVIVGNALLHFTLLLTALQTFTGNTAIVEHPAASGYRYNRLPPSIWRLKAMAILLLHPNVELHHLRQLRWIDSKTDYHFGSVPAGSSWTCPTHDWRWSHNGNLASPGGHRSKECPRVFHCSAEKIPRGILSNAFGFSLSTCRMCPTKWWSSSRWPSSSGLALGGDVPAAFSQRCWRAGFLPRFPLPKLDAIGCVMNIWLSVP